MGIAPSAVALPAAAAAAAHHGARVATGPVVHVTSGKLTRRSASKSRPHGLPARRSGRPKATNLGAAPLASSAPGRPGRAGGPRTAFGATSSFDGPTLADSGAYPPDTQGAVGPSQFLVTINGRFRSYAKATGVADGALNIDPDVFFSSVMSPTPSNGSVFTSDPHVRYDRLSQRWFIVMIDAPLDSSDNTTVANRILVAHSDGPVLTPSTVWTQFYVPVAGEFADYPTFGVDANALYIGVNNFSLSTGQFDSTDGYVIGKASALGSGLPVVHHFPLLTSSSTAGPFTPQGADNPDPGATQGYFIGVDAFVFDQLDVIRVSNPGGPTPTVSDSIPVTVPSTRLPINVPHLGNTGGAAGNLDALDDRLFAASIRGNHLWTAHNIGVTSAGVASDAPTRDGSRWYELNLAPTTPTVVQTGTVYDSATTNPLSYWIPTVAVSGQGHMAMGGSVAGAASHVNAWFSGRLASDTAGAIDAPTTYTASSFAYNPPYNRWGDYSAVSLDPTDDMTMWTIQEYVSATNTWGTRIAKLRAPGPATPATASQIPLGAASTSLVLTGDTAGGTGFFDPGPGFSRPQASVGCGITVSAVSVQSPGQATLTVNTTAATGASPCTIDFTNPDGQTSTASVAMTYGHAPVAVDDAFSTPRNTPLNGSSLLANDTDTDGDLLTAAKASDPAHGAATVAADGTFTYTPDAGYSGADSFTYTASDGTTATSATVSITVQPGPNQAPVAVNDAYSTAQDTPLNGSSLLANDTDADGDPLTAAKASDPAHGTVTVALNGTFSYTPTAGYSGSDSFTYTAGDGVASTPATVSITVTPAPAPPPPPVNRAPVVVDDAFTTPQGTALHGSSLLANDSDPDGNALTATKATDPSHGTVTVAPDGTFVYTPVSGYIGPDAFSYAASDGAATSVATASIMVTPSLQPPPAATKLTLKVAKLKRLKSGQRRMRASGKGPAGARVKLVVSLGKKKVATRTVKVSKGAAWTTIFKLKRTGRYTVVATTGKQKRTARKRL
jgi:VCBS repeat-containing protein